MTEDIDDKRSIIRQNNFVAIAIAVTAALFTLITSVVTTYLNNSAQIALETKKFESTLILEAVKSKDRNSASEMLLFLIESRLIEDKKDALKTLAENKKLPVFGRGGVPYKEDFINSIFSKFNKNNEISETLRAILIELADNIVSHRWNRVATFFEPDYFYQQLTFLSSNREIIDVFRQYIQEAFVEVEGEKYDFNIWDREGYIVLDEIKNIYFLDTYQGSGYGDIETLVITFELILSNERSVIVGFEMLKDTFLIVGSVG